MDMLKFLDSLTDSEIIDLTRALKDRGLSSEARLTAEEMVIARTDKVGAIKAVRYRLNCGLIMANELVNRYLQHSNDIT